MVLFSDTGLSKLILRKPADTAQAFIISGDNTQSFIYHDLTGSLSRLALTLLAYCNSRFCFLKYTKPVGEHNLQVANASASLLQTQFNIQHLFPLLTLTRSVKISYLSQYLQTLTLTSDILLKHFNHLITFIILTRSHKQPHPTWQILRHTRLATGTIPRLKKGDTGRIAAPGNVTYFNSRAVRCYSIYPANRKYLASLLISQVTWWSVRLLFFCIF